jgi:hypothetical protein
MCHADAPYRRDPNVRFVLGGNFIHNSRSFIDDLLQNPKEDEE